MNANLDGARGAVEIRHGFGAGVVDDRIGHVEAVCVVTIGIAVVIGRTGRAAKVPKDLVGRGTTGVEGQGLGSRVGARRGKKG